MQFTRTIGHEKQKKLLGQSWKSGTLAHAIAFCGPQHIGKTTLAVEFAALIGADPVLDLVVAGGDEPITIEQAREVQARLSLTPAGKYKVAVISADQLSAEAANSLLKLLEEPPARSYIFLTAVNFYNLLPTVASRVQKMTFSVPAEGLIGLLKRRQFDPEFALFYDSCEKFYDALKSPELVERLKNSEMTAALEIEQMKFFLKFAMRRWAAEPSAASLGKKLQTALFDLSANVNRKLAMDILYA